MLGKTFSTAALGAVADATEADLEPAAAGLVAQGDPVGRRPILARPSAASTASSRTSSHGSPTRRSRARAQGAPPRGGRYLEGVGARGDGDRRGGRGHYLDAYRAAPDADDAPRSRTRRGERLVRAASARPRWQQRRRRALLRAGAVALATRRCARAGLHERAGQMARGGEAHRWRRSAYRQALELFEASGATHGAARVSPPRRVDWQERPARAGARAMERVRRAGRRRARRRPGRAARGSSAPLLPAAPVEARRAS